MSAPLVYLILGTPGSGRRSVVADLVEFGSEDAARARVLVSTAESADPIGSRGEFAVSTYGWDGEALSASLSGDELDAVFLIADGRSNPANFVEAVYHLLKDSSCEMARAITVVDCALAEKTSKMRIWLDCCIHFSDVAILTNRAGVSNKWISSFMSRYRDGLCYPCLFEMDRKGRVRNPALVLDPTPRRISRIFEEPDEDSIDEEAEEGDDEVEDELELRPGDPSADPYLKRLPSGRREAVLPDIAEVIDAR